jgi:uncharacterized UPF0160 family protein
MFGIFKKKAPEGSFIILAVKAALVLRIEEKDNGGLYTSPEALRLTTDALAKDMNVDISGNLRQVTHGYVMALLMEQKFIDRLIDRAMTGPLGTLTQQDEDDVVRITRKITGVI